MIDRYANYPDAPTCSASRCFAIAPSADADLPEATRALYVGGAGDITLRPLAGEADVVFRNVPAGVILDVRVRAVRVAGTTATDLVGLV